jgi:hypothetical protein
MVNTFFPPLSEMLYASCIKLLAEASELFTHCVFQLVVRRMASSESIVQGSRKLEVGG